MLELATDPPDNDIDLAATTYVRAPWGTRASAAVPVFSVEARVATGSPAVDVIVASVPRTGAGYVIGRAAVAGNGTFAARDLTGGDRVDIYAAIVDRAGNASAFERIALGEWWATLTGKRRGSTFENPHALESWSVMPAIPAPADGSAGDEAEGAPLALADHDATRASTHVATTGRMRWTAVGSSTASPPLRREHSVVFDSARGRVVMFGGTNPLQVGQSETWEWDGRAFYDVTPVTPSPTQRHGASLAYDSTRGVVVMFGGRLAGLFDQKLNDTWEWDGTRWRGLQPIGARPPEREDGCMAFDSGRGRTVLFGGAAMPTSDVWEWDGERWFQITAPGGPPGHGCHMSYDVEHGRIVVANEMGIAPSAPTWLWDGAAWTEIPSAASGAHGAWLYYDTQRNAVVSWSPANPDNAAIPDRFWRWTGAEWIALGSSTVHVPPHPVPGSIAVTYDPIRGRPVRFCAPNLTTCAVEEFDGEQWTDVSPAPAPSPRYAAASTYDSAGGRVLMFGGEFIDPTTFARTFHDDTWEWNGRRWRCLAGSCTGSSQGSPPPRSNSGLAYDESRGIAVLYGGTGNGAVQLDDTWEWNGTAWSCAAGACSQAPRPADIPGRRHQHVMEYDEASERVLVFGGYVNGSSVSNQSNDTWIWDGDARQWLRLPVLGPPRRGAHAGAFDAATGRVAIFGGVSDGIQLYDLREYDAAEEEWVNLTPATGTVPSRRFHALAFDRRRQRLQLFGGQGNGDELWEFDFDGSRWLQIETSTPAPAARANPTLEYDSREGSLFVYGGLQADNTLRNFGDSWKGDFDARPGHLIRIDTVALAPAGAVAVDEITVRADTGADGSIDASQRAGAALHVWQGQEFERVSCNAAPAAAPADLSWTTRSPRVFTRAQSGKGLRFALSPVGGYAVNAPARLVTDYVEVRLRYHLPGATPAVAVDPNDPGTPSGACPAP